MPMKSRGYALLISLMLMILLVAAGLGFIGMRASQYRGVLQGTYAQSALATAEAGLSDAKMKFWKDPNFPPKGADDQDHYSYSETLRDLDGAIMGTYRVDIDLRYMAQPYAVIPVTSTGISGKPGEAPLAQRVIRAHFDVSPTLRDGTTTANPRYYDWLSYRDMGGW